MIYEWYSGSDATNLVPRGITGLYESYNATPHEQRVSVLEGLLQRESDTNWRGYLMYLIGRACSEADIERTAVEWYERAIAAFEPLARNFRDVGDEYCRTLIALIKDNFEKDGHEAQVADLGLRVVQSMRYADFNDLERFLVFSYLGNAFNRIGHMSNLAWCYEIALSFYLSAHHIDPDDPGCLEALMHCYYNLEQPVKAAAVFRLYTEVAEHDAYRETVESFFRERIQIKLPDA